MIPWDYDIDISIVKIMTARYWKIIVEEDHPRYLVFPTTPLLLGTFHNFCIDF